MERTGEDDHIHLPTEYPPRVPVTTLVNSLKVVAARGLRQGIRSAGHGTDVLKRREDPPPAADYGLLIRLGLLALTGMLTLLLRATPAYGLVLVTQLATIVVCFAVVPYTRFMHAVYRFLAIVGDNVEQRHPG